MTNVVVVGAQWGDEGKGKIVDWLSHRADVVVRFQGGHNAGHTLVVGDKTYKLSLLPSGVVQGKLSIIGNGVVIDPWALRDEIARVEAQGVRVHPQNLVIADNACLILPLHRDLDAGRETQAGAAQIGTTRRGIGPAYEDKVGRRAIRIVDLGDRNILAACIDRLLNHHNALRRGLDLPALDAQSLLDTLLEIAPFVLQFAGRAQDVLRKAHQSGQRILFEGAQGAMLDVDHGTYPFVTSSNTLAGQAAIGSGIGPRALGYVLGLAKAYSTRVGEGPLITELTDEIGRRISERGREFGTVTGRPRRCGWLDIVALRQACGISGVDGLALTKLDVLDGFERVQLCTHYRLGDEIFDHLPSSVAVQKQLQPVYEEMEGWQSTTQGARSWGQLPAQAVKFVRRVEELIDVPISLVSTSPERDDVILVRDPFAV